MFRRLLRRLVLKDVARISTNEEAISLLNTMEEALGLAEIMVKNKELLMSEEGKPFFEGMMNEMQDYLDMIDCKMGLKE